MQRLSIKSFDFPPFRNSAVRHTAGEKTASPNYRQFRNRLVIGLALASLLIVSILTWNVYSSYLELREESVSKTKIVASSIESQVSYAINFAELSLNSFVNALAVLPERDAGNSDTIKKILTAPGAEFGSEFWMQRAQVSRRPTTIR
jgi:hypothetical protein